MYPDALCAACKFFAQPEPILANGCGNGENPSSMDVSLDDAHTDRNGGRGQTDVIGALAGIQHAGGRGMRLDEDPPGNATAG
jgi:hypothetical protein